VVAPGLFFKAAGFVWPNPVIAPVASRPTLKAGTVVAPIAFLLEAPAPPGLFLETAGFVRPDVIIPTIGVSV
jgi:hypothetical protein